MNFSLLVRALLLSSVSLSIVPSALAQSAATVDTRASAPGNASFTLPAGWTATPKGSVLLLSPPEADLKIAIVEVGMAVGGRAAAAAAWEAYKPNGAHPFKLVTTRAPRNGWDEQIVVEYETSPAEHLDLLSVARRKGERWTVMILDGNYATSEKRNAPIGQISQSLRPAGYQPESFAGKSAHPLDEKLIADLLEFVRKGAADLKVPGVGLALYSGGRIVYEGGIGVKVAGRPDPIDSHTRFMIASNTKSMATLLLAKLVSEGRLRWDDQVIKVYPSFSLGDENTTNSVLIRHLVCACTGMPRKDMEWLFSIKAESPATDTFKYLAETLPTSKFGEVFQYNNLMASAAGYIAAHLYYPDMEIGAAFDRAVQEQIWDPLEMRDSTMSMNAALAANHASPHGEDIDRRLAVIPQNLNATIAPIRPAGGAWSSAHDMILYMRNELDEGRLPNGKQLLTKEALLARRDHNVLVSENIWYGMGLQDNARWGVSVIHHGGDLFGYHSDMYAIPSAGVGAVILTNSDSGVYLRGPFMRRLLEVLYDGQSEAEGELSAAVQRLTADYAEFRSKLTVPGDPSVITGLASSYVNPSLGTLRIERDGNMTRLYTAAWNTAIVTRPNNDGTVSLVTSEPEILGLDFLVGEQNDKRTLTLRDAQHVYVFTESAP